MAMTLIYCKTCSKLILIGNSIGRIGKPLGHDIRDEQGKVLETHWGQVHLQLPDEPWEPEKHDNIDQYIEALEVKYPKVEQIALIP